MKENFLIIWSIVKQSPGLSSKTFSNVTWALVAKKDKFDK